MKERLWGFVGNFGSFESKAADKIKTLYFPLANEILMSSITPDLHGDIKTGQNFFLLPPVSRIDLSNSKSSRNFWIYIDRDKIWSATGVSKDLKQIKQDNFKVEAGLLWYKITRENKNIGLKTEILSFVPASFEPVEIMQVKVTNISSKRIRFIPTAAIPIYARSAENIRDHRHVTSLLQRIKLNKFGVIIKPILVFDEAGHRPNKTHYFVLGWDQDFNPPQYLYPTQEMFCGEEGDLEAPRSILNNTLPKKEPMQGKETMGALRFRKITLAPANTYSYIILMGIVEDKTQIPKFINKFKSRERIKRSLEETKDFWVNKSKQIELSTGNSDFDNWFHWVSIQPTLRRIFGCSFLPDFDYGKGGRGWRDLWQDALGLILSNPEQVRSLLINNFSGVRIDGSNATIIGKKPGEFIADRNDIARVWMDHGAWPLLTLDLYLNDTGDFDILFEETTYFRDQHIFRSREVDRNREKESGNKLETIKGKDYKGSIFEHLLVQNLVQFFNVGSHNHVRLEGADWNDGLDMAKEFGESVTFSSMYAHNLKVLAEILKKCNKKKIKIAKEIAILLRKINYNDVKAKVGIIEDYFTATKDTVSGNKIEINLEKLIADLTAKSVWMANHIRKNEWLKEGFFNGYYNNDCERVEGKKKGLMRMTLTSQVFPILNEVAEDWQIEKILKNTQKYLRDKKLGGYHLNTDFKDAQPDLGRAFYFVYGDKENGAYFNHMIVMFAYALYKRGYVREGWGVLNSIYDMAMDTEKSKIYPCMPEYFNLEGKGMYAYLTGSASWFVLTILTQAFGIRGKDGDLFIEPKLTLKQFKGAKKITINRVFAARFFQINFFNPKKLDYGKYKITKANLGPQELDLREAGKHILIKHKTILNLAKDKLNILNIVLG